MKQYLRSFAAAACALVLTFSMVSCGAAGDIPDGMKLASSEDVTYTMYVPREWTVDISTGIASAYYSESDRSNVSMSAFNLDDSTLTAKECWDAYLADLTLTFPDIEIISEDNFILSETNAYQCVYTASVTGVEYQFMQVLCPRAGYLYVFTYTALPAKYEAHLDEVSAILATAKL